MNTPYRSQGRDARLALIAIAVASAIGGMPSHGGIIEFTGGDRLHAKWNLTNPYGGNVEIYWVVGANQTLIASGTHVVGQERRANLPNGQTCGYLVRSYGLNDWWDLVTIPTPVSGTLLYDESYTGTNGLTASIAVPAGRRLEFEGCNRLNLSASVAGTVELRNATNVTANLGVSGGTVALDGCTESALTLSGSGGHIVVTQCRLTNSVELTWSGSDAVFLNNIFDNLVQVRGNGYHFADNTFYATVGVGTADPRFDGNVFLSTLEIQSADALPTVRDNSFLGRVALRYSGLTQPTAPIPIEANYYGDPFGPILPGTREWSERSEHPYGGSFLSKDGAMVVASSSQLDVAPGLPTGKYRTDTRRFPAIWCNGIAYGANTLSHAPLRSEFFPVVRAGLPWVISLDVRGWDANIQGVRVYFDCNGQIYEGSRPTVRRDPLGAAGGRGLVKHGGTTFNIEVPALPPGNYPCALYLDTRGVTAYEEASGTNVLISQGYCQVYPAFSRPLHLMVVAWEIGCPGYAQYVPQTAQTVALLQQKLSAMLPLRRDEYRITVHPPGRYVAGFTGLYEIFSSTLLFNQLLSQLTEFLNTYNASTEDPVDRLFVVVPHGVLGSANGMAGSGVNSMRDRRICVLEDSGADAAIHELGHSFGLWTGVTGEQYSYWNYPPDGQVLEEVTAFSPDPGLRADAARIRHFPAILGDKQWHDVMGRKEPAWPNFDTLAGFGGGLRTLLGTAGSPPKGNTAWAVSDVQAPAPASLPEGQRRILIRALVDHRYRIFPGTVQAADVSTAGLGPIPPPDRVTGDRWYEFTAFDAGGVAVTNYRVVLEGLSTISTNPAIGGSPWQATFDYPDTAVRCEWRGGQYDWTLYWEGRLTNALSCSIARPTAGAVLSNSVEIAWQGTGTAPLLYRFHWSADGGATWNASGDFTDATNVVWPVEFLAPTETASFKIVASDGMKTAEARVDHLKRRPSPTHLTIIEPREGDRNHPSNTWTFVATAGDPHGGALTNISWTSSRDGWLGVGSTLEGLLLSTGAHTIVATVTGVGGSVTGRVQVAVEAFTNVDLMARSENFHVQPPMFDPVAAMPNFMAPGVSNYASFRVRNEGVTNRTHVALTLHVQPPGGAETLLASNAAALAAFEEADVQVGYVPATSGVYRFRASVTAVDPPDTNPANNEAAWFVPCGLGDLFVAFDPPEVATAAYWAVNGGPWQPSGATVSNLTAGTHTLSFQVPAGYLTPSNREAEVLSGRLTVYRRRIEKDQGYLRVTIAPAGAVAEGALWRVDGSPDWQTSGTTLSNVSVGAHIVSYRDIPWWGTPPAQTVMVAKAALTQTNATYVALPRPPPRAILGGPEDGATNQPRNTSVYWYGGGGDGVRVYFGTNPVPRATDWRTNLPYYIYYYDPGLLDYDTTYYWRIDPTNSIGVTTGIVWRFTTKPMGPEFTSPLYVEAEDGMFFAYRLTAVRATGVGAGNLPPWLSWNPPDTLSGIPDAPGLVLVPVWATNATQREDDTLAISVEGGTKALRWQAVSSGTTLDLRGVTCGAGLFVAVGEVGTVLTSSNGVTWVSRPTGRMETLNSVAWGNGRFVAVGSGGVILTSTNGVNWSLVTTGSAEYLGVCWGTNQFAAVGYNRTIRTSTTGTNWINRGAGGSEPLGGVVWGAQGFVAVGGLFSSGPSVFHSSDGVTWDWRDTGTWWDGFYGVAWGNGAYVAVGYGGKLMTSSNGVNWTTRYGAGSTLLRGVTFAENQFLAVGHSGAMYTSHRGGDWVAVNSGTSANLHAAAGGLRKFVVVGQGGTILVADYEPDRDGDGAPDWQERIAGTDPTNRQSVLRMTAVTMGSGGATVGWQSVTGRLYTLQRATNLLSGSGFIPVLSNVPGQAGTTTRADTNAPPGSPLFYRITVRE